VNGCGCSAIKIDAKTEGYQKAKRAAAILSGAEKRTYLIVEDGENYIVVAEEDFKPDPGLRVKEYFLPGQDNTARKL
jgi:hypothetical protein